MKEDKANGTLRYTEVQLSTGTLEAPVRRRRRRRRARRAHRDLPTHSYVRGLRERES